MNSISDGCRLCLDPFVECFTTIDNPQLKDQMEKVFCFSIEPNEVYCSGVCQSCSYAISEFYQYSEKVHRNQEVLKGNVKNYDPTVVSKDALERVKVETLSDSELPEWTDNACKPKDEVSGEEEAQILDTKITLERLKVETFSDSGLPETTEDAYQTKDEVSGDEWVPNFDSDESYEPPPKKSQTKRKTQPKKRELEDLDTDEPTKNSKQTTVKTHQERIEEDQLFSKHFRMICDLCGTSAATYTALRSHFWKEHKRRDGYIVCCKSKLFKRDAIREHIDFHANPDAFRCEVCGNKYKHKDSLNAHMMYMHSSEDQRPFMCDHCPLSFAQESSRAQHMKRHVQIECPNCKKNFAGKSSFSRHMTNQHSGKGRTLACDTCGKEFRNKQYLERHMNKHRSIVQRFQCGICQRWLKGEQSLRNHMNTIHSDGDQEFQCDICLQKYPHLAALSSHKFWVHTEPKHECEFCGKKFKKAIYLKEHRTIHTGEVLYACDYCGIPNNCMSNLYQHIKRQHPTEWAEKKLKATQMGGPS